VASPVPLRSRIRRHTDASELRRPVEINRVVISAPEAQERLQRLRSLLMRGAVRLVACTDGSRPLAGPSADAAGRTTMNQGREEDRDVQQHA